MRAIIKPRLEREAGLVMIMKKRSKIDLFKAIFGVFFVVIGMVAGVFGTVLSASTVNAIGETSEAAEVDDNNDNGAEPSDSSESSENSDNSDNSSNGTSLVGNSINEDSCKASMGEIGWLVCPTTGKIAEAVDWLYGKLQDILTIDPVSMEDGSPIYEIWKYCLSLTNIVFVIFLLVVIYSQLTGVGISNYGIKKVLPKLIVTAILVNLSFLICSLAVDLSNIIGNGVRGVFTAVEETVTANGVIDPEVAKELAIQAELADARGYISAAGGIGLAVIGGVIAVETGVIWMLIPVALGAIVAVVTGLVTIALRQAVVVLLIMIAPLAIVAYMLPNTEKWFKKWKELFIKMLVFYPMFSLLFGASSLAGFAIAASAKDGFGMLLGVAVQIFPLFFSWKLMQMSGTFLGTINARMQSLAAKPLATNRAWADSHRLNTKQKYLASGRAMTPSLRLMQFVSDQKIRRDAETGEYAELAKTRALAGQALKNYDKDGNVSKRGQKAYERQARGMRYQQIIEMNKDNFNRGLGGLGQEYKDTIAGMKSDFKYSAGVYSSAIKGRTLEDRLTYLDNANVNASDDLRFEMARGAKIEYENAKGFQERVSDAMNAHFDQEAIKAGNKNYQLHNVLSNDKNMARYNRMRNIMEGKDIDVHFAAADAAYSFDSQAQIVRGRFQKYMDLTAPTQDVVHRLQELTSNASSSSYIDPIIAGLRTLNMRGDTDLVRQQLDELTKNGKVELGTYTSQALASFAMFDVKDNDPFIRRFGKYINMETAKMYNEAAPGDRRTRKDVSFYEYVNGEYIDKDEEGNVLKDDDGNLKIRKVKRDAATLLKGTSFKGMERTAIANMIQSIRDYSVDIDEDGNETFSYDKFKKNEAAIWDAIMPNIISDQFTFLSGSEQIIALGKGITGVDSQKHNFDWEGIFGKKVAESLTPEQKKDYIDFVNKRTKTFLGGHVPAQIAKTKTDMLESIRNQYALKEAVDEDPEFLEKISQPGYKMDSDEYKTLESSHMDKIKKEFRGSFKKDALEGFAKMYQKGYQGEAKDGLIQLLDPGEIYEEYVRNNKGKKPQQRDDDDDDEGMPAGGSGASAEPAVGPIYNNARAAVDEAHARYRGTGGQADVAGFWNEAKEAIMMSTSGQMGALAGVVDQIEAALGQFTTVDQLYNYIMNVVFGGY